MEEAEVFGGFGREDQDCAGGCAGGGEGAYNRCVHSGIAYVEEDLAAGGHQCFGDGGDEGAEVVAEFVRAADEDWEFGLGEAGAGRRGAASEAFDRLLDSAAGVFDTWPWALMTRDTVAMDRPASAAIARTVIRSRCPIESVARRVSFRGGGGRRAGTSSCFIGAG